MKNKKILFGISGSFCNHAAILIELKKLCINNEVQVVVSENVYHMNTRYHGANLFIEEIEACTKNKVWYTLVEVEKIGPLKSFDVFLIVPCTSTVVSKLKNGIYDHPITLAAKAMIRNQKNVVLAIASNDFLGIGGSNLFTLMNYKNIYVVPFYQDDYILKPNSLVSDFTLLEECAKLAMTHVQMQPMLLVKELL